MGQLTGKKTGIYAYEYGGLAVGADHKIYVWVCGQGECNPTVEVFAAGATGNVKPIATIAGSDTGLQNGDGYIAVDNDGNIYVTATAAYSQGVVTVYPPGSDGNVAPTQTITGSNTGLSTVRGIAVDSAHNIYVANNGALTVFAAGSNGNVAPIQDITGSNTGLNFNSFGMAVDSAGNMYVANYDGVISVFAAGATGNVAPVRTITGTRTKLDRADSVALDSNGNIYVTNANGPESASYITVFAASANGNAKPIQEIKGSLTDLNGRYNTGIAVR